MENSRLCRYFLQGNCRFGTKCRFSHEAIEAHLLRHAESEFNTRLNYQLNTRELPREDYQFDTQLMDCGLTQQGLQQVQQLKGHLLPSYDCIFVSPLNRALETTQRLLDTHKIKAKAILVMPILTEVLSKICDFSLSVEQKVKRYPEFDFTRMGDREAWPRWQDPLVDEHLRGMIQGEQKDGFRYLQVLEQVFPEPLENRNLCFSRSMESVSTIKEMCRREGWKRVLVVSHNRILKYISGRDEKGRVPGLANCELRVTHI